MRFAFLIMGEHFNSSADNANIRGGAAAVYGVQNLDDACAAAKKLLSEGVGCIELCGAFGADGARAVASATDNSIPIGYVVNLPEQADLVKKAFGK